MTTPETKDVLPSEPMDVMAVLQANGRLLTIAAAIVVVAGGSLWVYKQSALTKETNASKALFQAQQSMLAQNPALAQSDLEKLVAKYSGTGAGSEGAMLLAQLHYDNGKFQEGITVLENATKSAPQPLQTEILVLLGDGYLSLKNPAAAAKQYETAAGLSGFELDRASEKAQAARAYTAAGDTAKSRKLWEELAEDPKSPATVAEAKVRLGELTAKSVKN